MKQFIELFDSVEVRSARNPHNKILSIIYVRVKQKEEKPVLSKVRRGGKRKKDADAERIVSICGSYENKKLQKRL